MFCFLSYSVPSNRNLTISYASEDIAVQWRGSNIRRNLVSMSLTSFILICAVRAYLVCGLLPSVFFTDVKFSLFPVFQSQTPHERVISELFS